MTGRSVADRDTSYNLRFALAKFRPMTLPTTLVTRSGLHDRLGAGAGQHLTVVVGSAGAGKSVLLSSWAEARSPCVTSWLSCDGADADPVRFWAGFIEATRVVVPGFGADAAELLAMDDAMSADVISSIANDAAKLPAGSAIVVDDFHHAVPGVWRDMTELVERWPAQTVQLVLSTRADPPLRMHRLRISGQLCELRDRDLYFSLADSGDLLEKFGVQVATADLALLHERSEGWPAAVQMAALMLRDTSNLERAIRALGARGQAIAGYFIGEVLDQQPPAMIQFMLDTSILDELTADACTAITDRQDTAAQLHTIEAGSLFLVALDDERTSFRYHHLARRLLRAELRARDRAREQKLQLRAAEWFESTGHPRRATRHLLAAKRPDRALTLMRDQVITDFLNDPALPAPPDLSMIAPPLLLDAPDRLLALAVDLLLSGEVARGGEYLDALDAALPSAPPDPGVAARLGIARALRFMLMGQADLAAGEILAMRAIGERAHASDAWAGIVPQVLLRIYRWLEDYKAVDREAAAAVATPELAESVKLVMVPGAQALALLEQGQLADAADAAAAAEKEASRLGFSHHVFAVDYLLALSGLALERRDLETAEQLAEQALSISERRRPSYAFLAMLQRAAIWAARGQVHDALASIGAARRILAGTKSVLLAEADELEAMLRLSLGDARSPAELAGQLAAAPRGLLLAKVALACGDHNVVQEHLRSPSLGDLTPRRALVRQLLLAAAAIERGDPMAAGIVGGALQKSHDGGFLNTVITTAPQLTGYLIEHATRLRQDAFMEQLVSAAVEIRAAQPHPTRSCHLPVEHLTAAETRVLKLLPTSSCPQIAATLYISRTTVKTHLRSIYQKLGAATRSEAIERAVDLRLL